MDIEEIIQHEGCPYIKRDPQGREDRLEAPDNVREVQVLELISYEKLGKQRCLTSQN